MEDTDQGIDNCVLQLLRGAPQLLCLDTNTLLEMASILKDEISLGSCWNHIVLEQPSFHCYCRFSFVGSENLFDYLVTSVPRKNQLCYQIK